jgi:hypothetical protein
MHFCMMCKVFLASGRSLRPPNLGIPHEQVFLITEIQLHLMPIFETKKSKPTASSAAAAAAAETQSARRWQYIGCTVGDGAAGAWPRFGG